MQDPFLVAPGDYKLEIENPYVRVVRVTYEARQKSPEHDHPGNPTVYVYTTDGGRMRIMHEGGSAVERPPVQAGQIRFSRGMPEHHTMENLGDARSEYIRVELKTKPADLPEKDIRLTPQGASFENGMIRISRQASPGNEQYPGVYVVLGSGTSTFVPAGAHYNAPASGGLVHVELKTAPK